MPDLFTTPFAGSLSVNPLHVLVRLLAALLLGGAVAWIYRRADGNAEMGASFPTTLVLLTVLIAMVTQVIGDNVARAFSLVGALSIVRFRAAIKEPEELAFLFLAISAGLGLGANATLITIVALVLIVGLIAIRSLLFRRPGPPNLYLTVASPAAANLGASQILAALAAVGASATLKRFDQTPDLIEAAFVVDFKQIGHLEQFNQRLRELSPQVRISCLDDRGLGA